MLLLLELSMPDGAIFDWWCDCRWRPLPPQTLTATTTAVAAVAAALHADDMLAAAVIVWCEWLCWWVVLVIFDVIWFDNADAVVVQRWAIDEFIVWWLCMWFCWWRWIEWRILWLPLILLLIFCTAAADITAKIVVAATAAVATVLLDVDCGWVIDNDGVDDDVRSSDDLDKFDDCGVTTDDVAVNVDNIDGCDWCCCCCCCWWCSVIVVVLLLMLLLLLIVILLMLFKILFQLILTRFLGGPIGGICCVAKARNASAIKCGCVAIIFFHPIVSITSVAWLFLN